MVSSLKNQCLKYTYKNIMFSITEDDLPLSLHSELKAMRNCCVSLDHTTAVINNHVQCLGKIHDILITVPWDCITMEIAAKSGSIDCLKYLYENGCPVNIDICNYAAEGGHLDCLRYLHLIDMPLTEQTCLFAAYNGHKDCLEYMMKNGCTWSDLIFEAVIKSKNLDIFVYAIQSGYTFSMHILDFLMREGSVDVLTYFLTILE